MKRINHKTTFFLWVIWQDSFNIEKSTLNLIIPKILDIKATTWTIVRRYAKRQVLPTKDKNILIFDDLHPLKFQSTGSYFNIFLDAEVNFNLKVKRKENSLRNIYFGKRLMTKGKFWNFL